MEVMQDYLINEKTVLFYGQYYTNGELYTVVVDGEDMFLVTMSPIQLIDHSLICYGSNFKGALKSASKLLGENRKMYPIKIDSLLNIWIFPTKSYKRDDCVWFALNHVKNTQSQGGKFTIVYMDYGHRFEIVMKESSFRDKRRTTEDLKDIITTNAKSSLKSTPEPPKGFMIVEKKRGYKCNSRI